MQHKIVVILASVAVLKVSSLSTLHLKASTHGALRFEKQNFQSECISGYTMLFLSLLGIWGPSLMVLYRRLSSSFPKLEIFPI
jgi:hypothetical protein